MKEIEKISSKINNFLCKDYVFVFFEVSTCVNMSKKDVWGALSGLFLLILILYIRINKYVNNK